METSAESAFHKFYYTRNFKFSWIKKKEEKEEEQEEEEEEEEEEQEGRQIQNLLIKMNLRTIIYDVLSLN